MLNIFVFHSLLPQFITILISFDFIWICAYFDKKCFWTYIPWIFFFFLVRVLILDCERFSEKVFWLSLFGCRENVVLEIE